VPSASVAGAGPLAVGLDGTGKYLHWGVVQLSLANLIVIVALFVAALLLPFPRDDQAGDGQSISPIHRVIWRGYSRDHPVKR